MCSKKGGREGEGGREGREGREGERHREVVSGVRCANLQALLLLLLCSCQLLRGQVGQQLDGAIAGALVQTPFRHCGQATLMRGAAAVGDPGVLIRLPS